MATEIISRNWFQRMGDAIGGILFGILLILVSMAVLWWNEGRSVHTAQTLAEGQGKVVSVKSDSVDSANNGKLIHLTGEATTDETLTDSDFEVEVSGDLQLRRKVEMYAWRENKKSETRKKVGGGTETVNSYSYDKVWTSDPESSSEFHEQKGHENPPMAYKSQTFVAEKAHVGAFQLGELTGQLDNFESYKVDKEDDTEGDQRIFFGEDSNPEVGDCKVSFQVVKPCQVSVLAQQNNDLLESYTAKSGGGSIYRLMVGQKSAKDMFGQMVAENNALTWGLRFLGWLFMVIGFALVLRPLSVMADVIPFLGDLVGVGTGLVAFASASAISLVVVALAWIAYRPLVGVGILALAGGFIFLLVKKKRS